jgi:hypothetical protein
VHTWVYLPVQYQQTSRVSSCLDLNPGCIAGIQEKRCRNVGGKRSVTHLRAERGRKVVSSPAKTIDSCAHSDTEWSQRNYLTLMLIQTQSGHNITTLPWCQEPYLNSCRDRGLQILDILAVHPRCHHRNKYLAENPLRLPSFGRLLHSAKLVNHSKQIRTQIRHKATWRRNKSINSNSEWEKRTTDTA